MSGYKLTDAEFKFISLIWDREPINSTELAKVCLERLGWKKSTTYTMLKKLCDRDILRNDHAVVTALVKREQAQKYESEAILNRAFGGSLPAFIATFIKDRRLTKEEVDKILQMMEEASK